MNFFFFNKVASFFDPIDIMHNFKRSLLLILCGTYGNECLYPSSILQRCKLYNLRDIS
jgi:hypothetical protein